MRYAAPLLALLFAFSCTACEGPTGPEGPAGSANVESTTIDVSGSDFSAGSNAEIAEYDVDGLTREVVNEGAVLAYTDFLGNLTAMPLTVPVANASITYTYNIRPGVFSLVVLRPEGSGAVADAFDDTSVRIVTVPPSEAAVAARSGAYETYDEAAQAFDLD